MQNHGICPSLYILNTDKKKIHTNKVTHILYEVINFRYTQRFLTKLQRDSQKWKICYLKILNKREQKE